MVWPKSISPFDVHIIDLIMEGDEIYDGLTSAGFDVLWDDRQESAGVKFHDAELIGIPIRVVIGRHWAEDKVEVQDLIRGEVKIVHKANLINLLKEALSSSTDQRASVSPPRICEEEDRKPRKQST